MPGPHPVDDAAAPSLDDSAALYRRRHDDAAAERDRLAARASNISNLRFLAFAAAIGALVWAELRPEYGAVALVLAALAGLGFFALIGVHSRVKTRERRADELARVNEEAGARLVRGWDALPPSPERARPGHAYSHDLDILGPASLARLLGTAGTGIGRARLRGWLLAPASVAEARERQTAVRELVPRLDFRQDLQVAGRLAGDPDRTELREFLEWAESGPWLLYRPLTRWLSRLIPLATLALGLLHMYGVVDRPWWMLTLLAGVVFSAMIAGKVHAIFDRASLGDAGLRHYAEVVRTIQREEFTSEPLRRIHDALGEDPDAGALLERLGWLTELADLRHNGMFYILLHWPTLWDFHVLSGLERWQKRAGHRVRGWVDAVGDLDALAALAGPPHDEPGWSFPELVEPSPPDEGASSATFAAEGLAHPLLPADGRVPNDVDVGPPGTFLMVTGSNMSGKSTLLRAIGVNAVLALAGGPVCARRLRLTAVDVFTSMRIEDSLERGVSLFMAELQRLKMVVDAADAARDRPVLYLLDEILHGTNTAERQVAVREVIGHLLRSRALGAISTHDLELATAEPLASSVVPVHFQETVHPEGHEPPMTFDYELREGIATSTNALKLVRLVGLARGAAAEKPGNGSREEREADTKPANEPE